MIRAMSSPVEKFVFSSFLSMLQNLIRLDPLKQTYRLSLLLLSPHLDELQFLSCGMGRLLHLSSRHPQPRQLHNSNPPLGSDPRTEWDITVDGWDIGDILIFHTFPSSSDQVLQETLDTIALQSPQSQADTLIKKAAPLLSEKKNHTVISIHRIG